MALFFEQFQGEMKNSLPDFAAISLAIFLARDILISSIFA
jgi:hypothetical protein